MKELVELIKHAAVKSQDGWIFIGKCHADCFHKMHHLNIKSSQRADHQGFVTSEGRYVERNVAARIAKTSGMVDSLPVEILFSEDLWSEQHNGKYKYNEISGYERNQ